MVPPVTPTTYKQFENINQVNQLIGNWNLKPALTMENKKAVIILELYEEANYVMESQCLTHLMDHIIYKEGMRWAANQGLIA